MPKKNVIEEAIKASAKKVETIISSDGEEVAETPIVAEETSVEVVADPVEPPVPPVEAQEEEAPKRLRGRRPGVVAVDGEATKSVSITMPASDMKKLRLLAVEFDSTVKDVVIKMIREQFVEVFKDESRYTE